MTSTTITRPEWIPAFLAALAQTGVVKAGVEATGKSHGTIYFQRRRNARFAAASEEALQPGSALAPQDIVMATASARNVGWRTLFLARLAETSSVDCIGLVALALARSGGPQLAPRGYRLRNSEIAPWLRFVKAAGLEAVAGPIEPADILLLRPGPAQHHLVISGDAGTIIHAHAGLRRVIYQPLPRDWALHTHWRVVADR